MKKVWIIGMAALLAAGFAGAGTAQADWLSDLRAKRAAEQQPAVQQTVQQPVVQQQTVQPTASQAPQAAPQQTQQNWIQQSATAQQVQQQAAQSNNISNKQNTRWLEVFQTPNYTIYIDKTSIKAEGKAQNREVSGWFRRVYNPAGAAWLGSESNGAVRANAINYSVYYAEYGVQSSRSWGWQYFDAEHHMLYDGSLPDARDDYRTGNYVPDSLNEQIRDTLFRMVGWDY